MNEEGRADPADDAWARPPKAVEYVDRGLMATIKRRWKVTLPTGIVLFTLIMWVGLQPLKGTIHVGICRTYIELRVRFPDTLRLTAWEWFNNGLRLYYTHIDAFGQNRSELTECDFNADGLTLAGILQNREPIPPEQVKAFNQTIPYIIEAKPDLVVPPPPTDNLILLKRD